LDPEKEIIIARRLFTVGPPGIKLTVPKGITVGKDVEVVWSGPSSPEDILFVSPPDWPEYDRPSDLSFAVRSAEGNSLRLPTPGIAGAWEVRYYSWANEVAISSAAFEILLPEVALSGPVEVSAGSIVSFKFSGRGGSGDYVFWSAPDMPANEYYTFDRGIQNAIESDIEDGSPITMVAPAETGNYEMRFYNVSHGGLLASHTVEVGPPDVTLDVPESVKAGSSFMIEVDGPDAPGDIVFMAPSEWKKNDYPASVSNRYSPRRKSIEVYAPRQTGTYEVRYYSWSNGVALTTKHFDVN
jgi:Ca-activated chloride channel family protein